MAARIIEAFARAFGILGFVTVFLWLSHQGFPQAWTLLALLYFTCVPITFVYGYLTDPPQSPEVNSRRLRFPKLLLIGIGVAIFAVGYALYGAKIEAAFYPVSV
jgi:hypothetical protein